MNKHYEVEWKLIDDFSRKNNLANIGIQGGETFLKEIEKEKNKEVRRMYLFKTYRSIARCYYKQREDKTSLKYLDKCLKLAKADEEYASCYWDIASNYGIKNDIDKCKKYFMLSEKMYMKLNNMKAISYILNTRAWYTQEVDIALKTLNITKEFSIGKKQEDKIIDTIFHIYLHNNQLTKAWEYLSKLKHNKERLRNLYLEFQDYQNKNKQTSFEQIC